MKLSELHTGERGVIVKVYGHGSFRKRIIEMGFVKGNKVKVILNAPLKDPIEYEIIGYKISLRREEAEKIEVISESEAKRMHSSSEALPALESEEVAVVLTKSNNRQKSPPGAALHSSRTGGTMLCRCRRIFSSARSTVPSAWKLQLSAQRIWPVLP